MLLDLSRTAFLTDLIGTFASNEAYTAEWGVDTDMTIASNPVHGTWGTGKKRIEYSAALKAVEADRTVYFWEMLKEASGGFEKPSGKKAETVIGPGSTSWEWGYGTQRALVEDVAARHGFTVRVVLDRRSATW